MRAVECRAAVAPIGVEKVLCYPGLRNIVSRKGTPLIIEGLGKSVGELEHRTATEALTQAQLQRVVVGYSVGHNQRDRPEIRVDALTSGGINDRIRFTGTHQVQTAIARVSNLQPVGCGDVPLNVYVITEVVGLRSLVESAE